MADTDQTAIPTTQRAYTMRLRPAHSSDKSAEARNLKTAEMQSTLWATHEAVNRGAKIFGEWLLTLRGGLDHRLASAGNEGNSWELRNRRVLLALSWLSVEDEAGALTNRDLIVAYGEGCKTQSDNKQERKRKVLGALRRILQERQVPESEIGDEYAPGTWLGDCAPSLSSAIRPDAVWVDRNSAFSRLCEEFSGLDLEYATRTVFSFFGPSEKYFFVADAETEENGAVEGEGADFRQRSRQWVSTHFGTGKKSDSTNISAALQKLADLDLQSFLGRSKLDLLKYCVEILESTPDGDPLNCLRAAVGWSTGRPSKGRLAIQNLPESLTEEALRILQKKFAEEAAEKEASASTKRVPVWIGQLREKVEKLVGIPYVTGRNLIGEYSVMLDHAARRVSIAHTWTKRAEAERRRFAEDGARISAIPLPMKEWLDRFSEMRSGTAGAAEGYRIRPRAVEGWDLIVRRWSQRGCTTAEDRVAAAREVQADWDDSKKFGDIQLFEALASDDAKCVWQVAFHPDPEPLKKYVAAMHALARQVAFKVPAYRHPHPLSHPVFCDFGNSRWAIRFAVHDCKKAEKSGKRVVGPADLHALEAILWNGETILPLELRWASNRLFRDLALDDIDADEAHPVTLGSRLGKSAVPSNKRVAILNVFEENDWNGRLQAPRPHLNRIASLLANGKVQAAEKLRNSLRWSLTFSPRLQPTGPFYEFAAQNGIVANRKGEYFPNAEENRRTERKAKAKLTLSRLPGLRLLSVDLGHRFAAACAVWQSLGGPEFLSEISGRAIESGGAGSADLYIHTRHTDEGGRDRITIYRRLGPDTLPDGKLHPAPWARLDRQFLIKLQGEERAARAATTDELAAVRQMEESFGREPESASSKKRVDELISNAVRTARLALRRHGDRARIAFAMTATYKPLPGDRKYLFSGESAFDAPEARHNAHVEFIQDALLLWHGLFSSKGWNDKAASDLWERFVVTLPGYQSPEAVDEETSGPERKKKRSENFDRLRGAAEALIKDAGRRSQLHSEWKERWEKDDRAWHGCLRWLQDWVRPSRDSRARLQVGGLSLTRLATLTELRRKVQVGFFSRLHPNGAKAQTRERFGQRTLETIERLREQRVKQLASRIVEAALGMGRIKLSTGSDRKRPKTRVDEPCHAVVIESLRNYRPDELQTRRENRALMDWSSGKVRKYLEEACQLYGLHLREVQPSYTSRQCSRTGLPGIRCVDVPVTQFQTAPFWRKTVKAAKKRLFQGKETAEDKFFSDLWDRYGVDSGTKLSAPTILRLPRRGGDLFVAAPVGKFSSANGLLSSTAKRALQADLNAAANIGLRALLDPDFPGTWWYVPCGVRDGNAAQDKVKGSACFSHPKMQLLSASEKSAQKRDIVNAWRDPSTVPLPGSAPWMNTTAYWNAVRVRAVEALRSFNGLLPPNPDLGSVDASLGDSHLKEPF
jgi:IS605 OrfB family transposase